jgi:hypothetical protein
MESSYHVRATEGFFVRGRGIVNPDEVVTLTKSETQDVVAANRGVVISKKEFDEGRRADFVPKNERGEPIKEQTFTRAELHARARAALAANQAPPTPFAGSGKGGGAAARVGA